MNYMVAGILIFLASVIVIEIFFYILKKIRAAKKADIRNRLKKYTFVENEAGDILKKRKLSDIQFFNNFLLSLPFVSGMEKLVVQAHSTHPLGVYILATPLLGVVGYWSGLLFLNTALLAMVLGIAAAIAPYFYLAILKNRRTNKFQAQLHEALDLIARALKAGHSFNSAMQLAAEEFGDPLGTEFQETIDELNFGVSLPDALKNLSVRVDCNEIKYFVIAVIIQKETGGNLAGLIESLADILRERFKFQGKIRILSAEGKMSAIILILLPFLIGGWLSFSNPKFLEPLVTETIGQIMLGGAGIMMIIGIFIMSRMVKIEV